MALKTSPIKVPIIGQDKLSKQLDSITKKTDKFRSRMNKIGGTLSRRVTLPLAAAGGVSLKFAKDFNKGMAEISTMLPGNSKRVLELKKNIMDMAVETGVPMEEIQDATYGIISAFGDGADTTDKLRISMKLAKAGVTTGAEALDLLSGVMLAYSEKSATAMENTANLSFIAMRAGKTTLPEMASAVLDATAYTSQFNASQKALFGTMGHLAGVTGSTSQATTQLAGVYGALMKPTTDLKKAVKMFGFESASAMGKAFDTDVLLKAFKIMSVGQKEVDKIAKSMGYKSFKVMRSTIGEADAIDAVTKKTNINVDTLGKLISRKEGQMAVMGATGKALDRYNDILGQVEKSEGAAEQAWKDYTEGVGKDSQKWDQTTEKFKKLGVTIGDKLLPALSKILDQLAPVFDYISKMDDETLSATIKWAGFAMALGPVAKGLGSVVGLGGNLISLIGKLGSKSKLVLKSVDNLSAGMEGLYSNKNISGIAKLTGMLKAIPAVAGSFAAGFGIGEAVDKLLLEPKSKKAEELAKSMKEREAEALSGMYKGASTEEKKKSLAGLQKDMMLMPMVRDPMSIENTLGRVVSWFDKSVKSPEEMMTEQIKSSIEAQKLLGESIKKDEQKIKIEIENKSDNEVKARKKGKMKRVPANTGTIMDGI